MATRYLLWYTVIKDVDIENNHALDSVAYLYDRFSNEILSG